MSNVPRYHPAQAGTVTFSHFRVPTRNECTRCTYEPIKEGGKSVICTACGTARAVDDRPPSAAPSQRDKDTPRLTGDAVA